MREKRYRVYDPMSGELVAEGDAIECAEKLGMTLRTFQRAEENFRRGHYKKWNIYDNSEQKPVTILKNEREAIKKWDDFTKPLRKHFGIPVYKQKEG